MINKSRFDYHIKKCDKGENRQYKGIDILNMCYNGKLKENDEFKHNGYRIVIKKDGYVVKPVVYDGDIKEDCNTTMAILLDKENTFTKVDKIDPTTLKRNDKVQVRDDEDEEWKNVYFMDYELGSDKPFLVSPIPIEDSVDVMKEDDFTKIAIVDCFSEFRYCRLCKED